VSEYPSDQPPSGDGQEAIAPPPGQGYYPPGQGFPPPPAVPGGYGYGYGYGQLPAPGAPQGLYLDPESGLMLPEGTKLAGVGRRIGAYFLAIPLCIVTLGVGYVVWGAIVWANGQTPALQVLGMRVYRPETSKVAGWWFMALREIVGRICDGILGLISGITSFVLFVASREHKAIHDHIAGTVVLHDPDKVLTR
jgi:uncharacterized RDD family membrane protein YckC